MSPLRTTAVVAGLLLACGGPARAQDTERKNLMRAFDELNARYQRSRSADGGNAKAIGGSRFDPVAARIQGAPVQATNMVKVWAELENGQKVNLSAYGWSRKEKFTLFFESARPVHVGLYQVYPDKGQERQVLPDQGFPESNRPLPAGKAVALPIQLQMDATDDDEVMRISLITVGAPEEPPAPNRTRVDPADAEEVREATVKGIQLYKTKFDQAHRAAVQRGLELPTNVRPVEVGREKFDAVSTKTDDVAVLIPIGPEQRGYATITLKKK
jgi:hypothetical protein